jgi:hypothetical protein
MRMRVVPLRKSRLPAEERETAKLPWGLSSPWKAGPAPPYGGDNGSAHSSRPCCGS